MRLKLRHYPNNVAILIVLKLSTIITSTKTIGFDAKFHTQKNGGCGICENLGSIICIKIKFKV